MFPKKHKHNNLIIGILLFILFIFLASIFTNMPVTEIGKKMPFQPDSFLVSWIWSWEIHILTTSPLDLFQANIFAPFDNTLAFTEPMLGTMILAAPIILIFDNVILAYNLVVLLSFAISGLGMYLLVFYLTKNKWAGLLAALIFAFAPLKLIHNIQHLHLTGMWLPFVFLYLHKFFKNNSWKNILLLTLFIILVFLTGFHYFIFLPIVFLVFGLTLLIKKVFVFNRHNIIKIIISVIILSAIIIPVLIPYIQVREDYKQARTVEEIEAYSPALIDYIVSPFFYNHFYKIGEDKTEKTKLHLEMVIGPGIMVLLLLFWSIYTLFIKLRKDQPTESKNNYLIYGIIGLISLSISFGYYIKLYPDSQHLFIGPYAFFYHLMPGFDGIRSTGRYTIFTLLSASIFIGYLLSTYYDRIKDIFKRNIIFSSVLILMLLEFSFVPPVDYLLVKRQENDIQMYQWLDNQKKDNIFLHLPMGLNQETKNNYDIFYLFNSRHGFPKIVNGYSGYYPPGYLQLVRALMADFEPEEDLAEIKKFKVDYLIFHFDSFDQWPNYKKETLEKLDNSDNFVFVNNFDEQYVYQVIYD